MHMFWIGSRDPFWDPQHACFWAILQIAHSLLPIYDVRLLDGIITDGYLLLDFGSRTI